MANRFWVGGAGNWSDTAKWSTTSGGAGGASVPGAADVAVFDAASDSGTAFTATVDTAFTITTLNISAVDVVVTIGTAGNLTCSTSTTHSASTGTNGAIISGNASLGAVTLTSGTLNIDGNTVTMSTFTSIATQTRTFNFGTNGVVTLTGSGATIWNCTTAGTSTTSGTGTVNCTYSGGTGTRTIVNNHDTGNASVTFNITAGTDTVTFSTSAAVNSLSFTGFSGSWTNTTLSIAGSLTVSTGMTVNGLGATVTFTATTSQTITTSGKTLDFPITFNGVGGTWTLQDNCTVGASRATNLTAGTLALGANTLSTGSFVSNNTNTRTLDFGTGKIQITFAGGNLEILEGRTLTNLTVSGTAPLIEIIGTGTNIYTWSWGNTGGSLARAVSVSFLKTTACTFSTQGASSVLNVIINCSLATWNIGTAGSNLYGNFTITAVGTLGSGTGILTFAATSGTKTITTSGKTLDFPVTINGAGGTFALQESVTLGSTRTFTLTAGTLDLTGNSGNWTLSTGRFASSNTNTRSIVFGTGKIQLTNAAGGTVLLWDTPTLAGFSYTGTPVVEVTGVQASTSRTIDHGGTSGGTESNALSFDIKAGTDAIILGGHFKNVDFTGFAGTLNNNVRFIYGNLTISVGMTLAAGTSSTTFAATSGTKTITVNGKTIDFPITINGAGGTFALQESVTLGSTRLFSLQAGTLDLTGNSGNWTLTAGTFGLSSSVARAITFGTGKIVITGSGATVWSATILTNFSYTGTPTVEFTYSGSVGTRGIIHGTTGGTEARAVSFAITAGSDATTLDGIVKNFIFTGYSGTYTGNASRDQTIYGNLTLGSGMTFADSGKVLIFGATSGTQDITSNGVTIGQGININGVGGTTRLQDALTINAARTLTLTNGTFNANNFNVTTGLVNSNFGSVRTLTMGSGTWTLSGTSNVWNLTTTTNLTFNKDTANIVLSDTSVTARTFAGGGLTYNDLTIGGTTGTSTLTFTGSNTFGTISSTKTVAHTILFTAGTTTTVSNWTVTGTVGNVVTIGSVTAASHTLTKTGGGTINVNYSSISQSSATPASTWYALTTNGNTDGGNNTGWIFSAVPTNTGNFFLMFN